MKFSIRGRKRFLMNSGWIIYLFSYRWVSNEIHFLVHWQVVTSPKFNDHSLIAFLSRRKHLTASECQVGFPSVTLNFPSRM